VYAAAFVPLVVWPLVAGRRVGPGARRAAGLVSGSLLADAWVIVPQLMRCDDA
jgi:hypothetical protein